MSKKNIPVKLKKGIPKLEVEKYVLELFVTGLSTNSIKAIVNIKRICEEYLEGNYQLEIIDITVQPKLAIKEEILVVPILIKKKPLPEVRMIGDLSDTKKVLEGLGIYQ